MDKGRDQAGALLLSLLVAELVQKGISQSRAVCRG